MLKKRIAILLGSIIIGVTTITTTALAQPVSNPAQLYDADYLTEIQSTDFAEIRSPIIFLAKPQFDTEIYTNIKYEWDFGDYNYDEGNEVAHSFNEAGSYSVNLKVKINSTIVYETNKEIFIPIEAAIFITDIDNEVNKINTIIKSAEESNVYLRLIDSFASQSEFLSEEVLARKLTKIEDSLSKIDTIVVWTKSGAGLNALTRYKQTTKDPNVFNNKSIILIENDLSNLRRVKRQFNQLMPKEIIAVQEAALLQFIDTPNVEEFKSKLNKSGFDFKIITPEKIRITPFNILSFFLDYLTEKGIPDNTVVLILLLPIIATVIAFMKQVIGITTLGIYTPTIITLTFLVLGLKFGIVILFFIVLMGTIAHKLVKPLKLLYIPKMALVMTGVSIIIFILLSLTVYLNLFDIEFISLAIFPVVIMGTLTEKFVSLRSEKGISSSILIMIETFFVSLTAYFLTGGTIDLYFIDIKFEFLRNLVLNTPEVIIFFILINIYLGRWTGLQVSEYIQFREVISNSEE